MAHKGMFKPLNPQKYKGNANNIVYRSSWELKVMMRLDAHPDVVWWASEEMHIKYLSPVDNRVHRYFPDFIVNRKDNNGNTATLMIEVKPARQTKLPPKPKKPGVRYLKEVKTYAINKAKFEAAEQFCSKQGWQFVVLTEKEILGI